MKDHEFISELREAFKREVYPGEKDILHCSYDKAWGGTLDGPCRECSEVVSYFKNMGQYGHPPRKLGWVAFGLTKLTPEAFAFWLPSFIETSVLYGVEADSVIESLEFRFESLESKEWQDSHIGKLSKEQLIVIKKFFSLSLEKNLTDDDLYNSSICTLEYYEKKFC
ncbi:MAG: hypothetical protein KZQ83_17985 [gamma proteobacterium symbiont of Taylorina sp.]|nr:hypothetical protein [gamma proteobacterium symbiont of Taylorina sp.]